MESNAKPNTQAIATKNLFEKTSHWCVGYSNGHSVTYMVPTEVGAIYPIVLPTRENPASITAVYVGRGKDIGTCLYRAKPIFGRLNHQSAIELFVSVSRKVAPNIHNILGISARPLNFIDATHYRRVALAFSTELLELAEAQELERTSE